MMTIVKRTIAARCNTGTAFFVVHIALGFATYEGRRTLRRVKVRFGTAHALECARAPQRQRLATAARLPKIKRRGGLLCGRSWCSAGSRRGQASRPCDRSDRRDGDKPPVWGDSQLSRLPRLKRQESAKVVNTVLITYIYMAKLLKKFKEKKRGGSNTQIALAHTGTSRLPCWR